jgi:hypothetical protein
VLIVTLTGGLALGGCGSDPEISEDAAARLQSQVAAIEYAIAGGNIPAAEDGLERLRQTTEGLAENGGVSDRRAVLIDEAIEGVEESLAPTEAAPVTTTPPPPPTTVLVIPEEDDEDEERDDEGPGGGGPGREDKPERPGPGHDRGPDDDDD